MSTYFTASDANRYDGQESDDLLKQFQLIRRARNTEVDSYVLMALDEHSDYIRDILINRNYTPIYDLMKN